MFDISATTIEELVIHRIGNKLREEGISISKTEAEPGEDVKSILLRSYLGGALKGNESYDFYHDSDISLNEMYAYSREYFLGSDSFLSISEKIAKHLYSKSTHPNVAGGDLFVAVFNSIRIDEVSSRAIGVFKTEIKEPYLLIDDINGNLCVHKNEGINPASIQKGAIIFEHNRGIYAVDRLSGKSKYWLESFLNIRPRATGTRAALLATKMFTTTMAELHDPAQANVYKNEFIAMTKNKDNLLIEDITTLGAKYLGTKKNDEVLSKVSEELQFERDPQQKIEKTKLEKALRPHIKKLKIIDGLELLLSKGITLESVNAITSEQENSITIKVHLGEH